MLIESLYLDRGDVQVVNTRNDGALPDLAADDVVEVPCRIDRDGAHPLPLEPLAPEQHGLVAQAKAYERLTVRAALSGDRDVALKALMTNPLGTRVRRGRAVARGPARGESGVPAALLPADLTARRRLAARAQDPNDPASLTCPSGAGYRA